MQWKPGEELLIALIGHVRRSLPRDQRGALDSFVQRKFGAVAAQLDAWILKDSLTESRRAVPDDVLFGEDPAGRKALLLPILGNYWAMHALVRRAIERGAERHMEIKKLLAELGLRERRTDDEHAAIAAVTGKPYAGEWLPPPYSRASPVDTKTPKGRATLDRRLLVALRRLPVRSVPALHREVGGTPTQVRDALKRLTRRGRVWSHKLRGYRKSEEALQRDVRLWDLTDAKSDLTETQFDKLIVDALRRLGQGQLTELQDLVGGSILDVRASLDRLDTSGKRVFASYDRGLVFWHVT